MIPARPLLRLLDALARTLAREDRRVLLEERREREDVTPQASPPAAPGPGGAGEATPTLPPPKA